MRADNAAGLEQAPGSVRPPGRRVDRGGGVHRGPRGLLRHHHGRRPGGHDFVSHYYPNVLEAMRDPVDLAAVHLHQPDRHRAGATTSCGRWAGGSSPRSASGRRRRTWSGSSGPKGLKFCEIGCRPPGVRAWDLYAAGNDMDIYREWAMASCTAGTGQRRRAASPRASSRCAPIATAASAATTGVDEVERRFGEWIIDAHLPPPGTPTQPVDGRVHGQRVGADAPPRLRRAARACSTRSGARCTSTPRESSTCSGPQRRPTWQRWSRSLRLRRADRHDHRRMAGARA